MHERRQTLPLTDDQIEEIAERAAEKAVAKMTAQFYQQVGKGVVSKLLTVIGVITVGAYMWLSSHGWVK